MHLSGRGGWLGGELAADKPIGQYCEHVSEWSSGNKHSMTHAGMAAFLFNRRRSGRWTQQCCDYIPADAPA